MPDFDCSHAFSECVIGNNKVKLNSLIINKLIAINCSNSRFGSGGQ